MNQTTNLDQPCERKHKKVLVAVHCDGRQEWALVDAEKVGRQYQVKLAALLGMLNAVRDGDSNRRVFWG